ncbi:MAG: nicotinate-nucleotide adenylyltransferase [Dysgonamonadaceae bacterium]|jgi:nicotinate-nucleotide adenylyltransferase|nr:nicotinate-nucleotide adenylyltransferase [Dysgonamonadaceae bacterium]
MLSIGIFSGSFNPVHIGHLAVANYICEYESLDEVWFLVTPQTPYGDKVVEYSLERRLLWLQTAIRDYPKFKVSDFERQLSPPYYTYRTLRALQEQHPDCRFSLLIGADNWAIFDRWKESEALLNEFQVIVYPRKGAEDALNKKPANVRFCPAPLIEISSTFIRESMKSGKDLRFFLPEGIVI